MQAAPPGRTARIIVEKFEDGPGGSWNIVALLMPPAAEPQDQYHVLPAVALVSMSTRWWKP